MSTWFVVHTKPRQEAEARAQLERQGYPVYFPRLRLPRLRRSRWAEVIEPLFPRYLFVAVEVGEQALAPVGSTRGVSAVLRFGPRYAEAPAELVSTLRARENPDGLHALVDTALARGDRLRVLAGPFEGFEAVFEAHSGPERARVLLEVLGRQTEVTLPRGYLVPRVQRAGAAGRC